MVCYTSRAVLVSLLASYCLTAIVGCNRVPRVEVPKVNPERGAAQAMEMYDTDKDGKLDANELKKIESLTELANDGVVTAEGIAMQLKKWSDGNVGRLRFNLEILHNKKPLVGADVKLVPEKFMGKAWVVATGKTRENGLAMMSVPEKDPGIAGIPLGLYRVEITKDGESIPAKYNTETTLSIGVYSPAAGGRGPTLNLDY
jgi:hypothetical protein